MTVTPSLSRRPSMNALVVWSLFSIRPPALEAYGAATRGAAGYRRRRQVIRIKRTDTFGGVVFRNRYVPTAENPADFLTKPFKSPAHFRELRNKVMNIRD